MGSVTDGLAVKTAVFVATGIGECSVARDPLTNVSETPQANTAKPRNTFNWRKGITMTLNLAMSKLSLKQKSLKYLQRSRFAS